MIKLTKIYTGTGDEGQTGLGDGSRVDKTDLRVEAYGTVDEANAAIGVVVASGPPGAIGEILLRIQNDLFDVGADLCTPAVEGEEAGKALRVREAQIERLEHWIDEHNEPLGALTSFVLPGGTPVAAALHVARTVVRRSERRTVAWGQTQPGGAEGEAASRPIRYLNRLSDLLFVLARAANADPDTGRGDVLWEPGGNDKAGTV